MTIEEARRVALDVKRRTSKKEALTKAEWRLFWIAVARLISDETAATERRTKALLRRYDH